ncbi:MAG TPA: hypothetical protein VIK53_06360 [Verrucomicrobiae bacterium]
MVVALVLTTGLHWAALQTVAWMTMLTDNLHSSSFHDAVAETFDGRHPCCLCKAIAAAKKSERKSEAVLPVLKLESPPHIEQITLISPKQFSAFSLEGLFADSSFPKPPVPPPRAFQV